MPSIKAYIPRLARVVGLTPDALYERQRLLVRAGHLQHEGQGPGRGVQATADSVALLLTSVLATDRLNAAQARVEGLISARPGGGRCPYTNARSLLTAISNLLETTSKADSVERIVVSRTADLARIEWRDSVFGPAGVVEFIGRAKKEPAIAVAATLNHEALAKIAADVQAMVMEQFEEADQ